MSNFNQIVFEEKHPLSEIFMLNNFKSEEDESLFNKLCEDEYVLRKCANREKRLKDIYHYTQTLMPELIQNRQKKQHYVIDIGPGPGELLELARFYGFEHMGFDAKLEDCEMGSGYVLFSNLISRTQDLNIEYCDFYETKNNLPLEEKSVAAINSRGSIEQVFRKHLIGVPHKVHKNAQQLTWNIDDSLREEFEKMFLEFKRVLVVGGIILIHGNGAANVAEYNKLLIETVESIEGLVLEGSDGVRLHRIRRHQ